MMRTRNNYNLFPVPLQWDWKYTAVKLRFHCYAFQNEIIKKIVNNPKAIDDYFGDPPGVRTQDPILKRDVLYRLS